MATINPDMLKQLLQEFEEKEAVTREEINAINDQINELEKRIQSSKERLESVARDRDKIAQMKARYAEGDWSSVLNDVKIKSNGKEQAPAQRLVEAIVSQQVTTNEPEQASANHPTPAPVAESAQQDIATFDSLPSLPQSDELRQVPESAGQSMPLPSPAGPEGMPADQLAGLFSFSQNQQQSQVQEQAQGDIPWAPPPSMTWESVGSHSTFPTPAPGAQDYQYGAVNPYQQQQQVQQNAYQQQQAENSITQTQPNYPDANQSNQQPYPQQYQQQVQSQDAVQYQAALQAQQADTQGQVYAVPGQTQAPPQEPVLTNAYDEEFDISDALRGDEEPKDKGGESDKKIKDALRGLFS